MKNSTNLKVIGIGLATLALCCFGLQQFAFAQQACEVITVFPLGETWSYDDTGIGYTDQAWTAFNFDDSGWSTGPAPFGFGDPWVVTETAIEKGTYYYRKKFDFSGDASEIKALVMRALFDDGFIVYLNGTEIIRREMPIGPPTPEQFGFEHEVRNPLGEFLDLINPDSSVTIVDKFLPVDNILAVEVHNVSLTSSDHSFDAGLWYSNELEIVTPLPLGSTWLRDNTFSDLGTAWREIGYDDSNWVEECAPIGIEDDLPNPVCTELPTTILNGYYFRTTFTIEHDLSLIDSLFVIAQYDDGIEIFINGQRLLRGFLGIGLEGEVTWDIFAAFHDSHPRQVFNVSDQKDLFVKGENLLALTVKQQALTSSDIYMDVGVSYRFCEMATSTGEFPFGSEWKYNDTGTDLGTEWRETSFDDSGWSSGLGVFGYGSISGHPIVTTLDFGTDSNNKYPTYYFRKSVEVSDPTALSDLLLGLVIDDGAVVYVNGTEIGRYNLPEGTILYETRSDEFTPDESAIWPFPFENTLLTAGTNVIAVEIHQQLPGSSDVGFDCEFTSTLTTGIEDTENENIPAKFTLDQNFPNPFNPSTTIRVDIAANQPSNQNIRVEIYDLLGRKVRTLFDGTHSPGTLHLNWNATDDKGAAVATGIYIYRLRAGATDVARRMILLR